MRGLAVGLILAVAGTATASAAQDTPYGSSISFIAFRNGEAIGRHNVSFQRNGQELKVATSIDLAVKVLGFTAYRYTHRAQEMWNGDAFLSLSSQTDDNGKKVAVQAQRDGSGLKVVRSARPEAIQAAAADQGLQRDETVRQTLPQQLLPSSHWNFRQIKQSALLNTQTGAESRVQITPVGREQVKTSTGTVQATRYRYTGDVAKDQWFDDLGRWVKTSFVASDGSTIEYILQE